ncbi:hypothetical protein A3H75_00805 [Candidatus Uhrbacteria bacterium RIFCSPLOWO2_02_FULL_51_9]|uniref:Beta-lactamase class A catalytic domain-containing protein n=1 Tax=Candidatus Uhrbacteria bacterium RIFCSPLOWO2_02_FULL_51_9 TaxID=1802410 RepID=A0A1F7VF39_9BACT|nr:MAG: hypothetical protein A3H75_00805 [Candidatus Uhrbacteria bacterium RIFCSPLOWO2_02_FULL_51_9]
MEKQLVRMNKIPFLLLGLALLFGVIIGWTIKTWRVRHGIGATACYAESLRLGQKGLTNPLLVCDVGGNQEFPEFIQLKNHLLDTIDSKKASGAVSSVSVYFRAYGRGKWLLINDEELYAPASMLKVPIMMAYLKAAESEPKILEQVLLYDDSQDYNIAQRYPASERLKTGGLYRVDELIRRMIVYSDNNTLHLLDDGLSSEKIAEMYTALGLQTPPMPTAEQVNFLTVKDYAYFFRVLYNSTLLSRTMSERALSLLTETTFREGLAATVPDDIKMAHKFGERTLSLQPPIQRELHDCGIIYHPENPYLLCVMTKGEQFDQLAETIREIGKAVYEEVGRLPNIPSKEN